MDEATTPFTLRPSYAILHSRTPLSHANIVWLLENLPVALTYDPAGHALQAEAPVSEGVSETHGRVVLIHCTYDATFFSGGVRKLLGDSRESHPDTLYFNTMHQFFGISSLFWRNSRMWCFRQRWPDTVQISNILNRNEEHGSSNSPFLKRPEWRLPKRRSRA